MKEWHRLWEELERWGIKTKNQTIALSRLSTTQQHELDRLVQDIPHTRDSYQLKLLVEPWHEISFYCQKQRGKEVGERVVYVVLPGPGREWTGTDLRLLVTANFYRNKLVCLGYTCRLIGIPLLDRSLTKQDHVDVETDGETRLWDQEDAWNEIENTWNESMTFLNSYGFCIDGLPISFPKRSEVHTSWNSAWRQHVTSALEPACTLVFPQQDSWWNRLPDSIHKVPVASCTGISGLSALDEAVDRVSLESPHEPDSALAKVLGRTELVAQLLSVRTVHRLEFVQGRIRGQPPRGIYFQYTHARCCGITRNRTHVPDLTTLDWSLVNEERIQTLVRLGHEFEGVLRKQEPCVLYSWLDRMCTLVSSLYYSVRVKGEHERGDVRWVVLEYCRERIECALGVLGVTGVQQM
jgi:hypothetical protein